ncbi:BTB/POZ domain-containing protein 6-like isoform X3 [Crassostrea virginica]
MAASIVDDWQSCRNLQFCNRHMLTNQVACDIDFMVGEDQERIPAHKYILISRSCVFLTMFCGPLAETQREINLPDIEPTVFNALLEFLYTDSVSLQSDIVLPLLYAAKKYSVQALVKQCIHFLDLNEETTDVESICAILEQSHCYNENELQKKCMKYICRHTKDVMVSEHFLKLPFHCLEVILSSDELQIDEKSVLEATLKWANARCKEKDLETTAENQRRMLGDLIYLVRFPLLGDQYFTEVVSDMDILTDSEKVELFKYFFKKDRNKKCKFSAINRYSGVDSPTSMTTSFHSDVNDSRPIQTCIRYQTVYEDGSWYCGGEPDAISFTCNERISLHGLLVYGSYIGEGVYEVTCSIYDMMDVERVSRKTRLKTSESQHTYPILLETPIEIGPGKKHSLVVKLISSDGLDTYQGKNGLSTVNCSGVRFSFSKSKFSRNGTDVKIGQIPGILFTTHKDFSDEYDSS